MNDDSYKAWNEWQRLDIMLYRNVILPGIGVFFLYGIMMLLGGWDVEIPIIDPLFGGKRNMHLFFAITIPPCVLWLGGLYYARKDRMSNAFKVDNTEMIKIIENILKQQELPYKKLSLSLVKNEKTLKRFPLKFAEIFDVDNGWISIGVQYSIGPNCAVDIGPVKEKEDIGSVGIEILIHEIEQAVEKVWSKSRE